MPRQSSFRSQLFACVLLVVCSLGAPEQTSPPVLTTDLARDTEPLDSGSSSSPAPTPPASDAPVANAVHIVARRTTTISILQAVDAVRRLLCTGGDDFRSSLCPGAAEDLDVYPTGLSQFIRVDDPVPSVTLSLNESSMLIELTSMPESLLWSDTGFGNVTNVSVNPLFPLPPVSERGDHQLDVHVSLPVAPSRYPQYSFYHFRRRLQNVRLVPSSADVSLAWNETLPSLCSISFIETPGESDQQLVLHLRLAMSSLSHQVELEGLDWAALVSEKYELHDDTGITETGYPLATELTNFSVVVSGSLVNFSAPSADTFMRGNRLLVELESAGYFPFSSFAAVLAANSFISINTSAAAPVAASNVTLVGNVAYPSPSGTTLSTNPYRQFLVVSFPTAEVQRHLLTLYQSGNFVSIPGVQFSSIWRLVATQPDDNSKVKGLRASTISVIVSIGFLFMIGLISVSRRITMRRKIVQQINRDRKFSGNSSIHSDDGTTIQILSGPSDETRSSGVSTRGSDKGVRRSLANQSRPELAVSMQFTNPSTEPNAEEAKEDKRPLLEPPPPTDDVEAKDTPARQPQVAYEPPVVPAASPNTESERPDSKDAAVKVESPPKKAAESSLQSASQEEDAEIKPPATTTTAGDAKDGSEQALLSPLVPFIQAEETAEGNETSTVKAQPDESPAEQQEESSVPDQPENHTVDALAPPFSTTGATEEQDRQQPPVESPNDTPRNPSDNPEAGKPVFTPTDTLAGVGFDVESAHTAQNDTVQPPHSSPVVVSQADI